ncbi:MAG: DUF721 domain-containing protein [Chitinophagales bacterium]|nr:DUF721 domain-containing protein [Chitinophagales bacterium]
MVSKSKNIDSKFGKSISIADAMGVYLKENKLDKKIQAHRVVEGFIQSLPLSFRKDVIKAEFSNGILSVHVNSAPFRQNLQMASNSILETINDNLGATIVHKLLLR